MDEELLSETLEALAAPHTARAMRKQIRTLKGIRGTPPGEVARVAAAAWQQEPVDLDHDSEALDRLFSAAWEDGMVAIALTAAAVPDAPHAAWDLGQRWLERVDDLATADALGWLVLGPAVLASGRPITHLTNLAGRGHVAARRAAVSAGLAMLPEPIEGPAAAALRERVGERHVQLVEDALSPALAALASAFVKDEAPEVRKGLRRVIRTWTRSDPAAVAAWADDVRGGLPKILGDEVKRARRKAERAE